MEVVIIEKETFDTLISEHEMLCEIITGLARQVQRKLPGDLLSVKQACEIMHISPATLQNLRISGKIGFVREANGAISYPVKEVTGYLERCGMPNKAMADGR